MNNPTPVELLELYLLGELDEPQVKQVEEWLGSDKNAERELQAARELLGEVDRQLTRPPDVDLFCNRVVDTIRKKPIAAEAPRVLNRRPRLIASVLGVAAVVAAIVLPILFTRPGIEPSFKGPIPTAISNGFAPKPWFVAATGAAEFESSEDNKLKVESGEIEVSSLKPCEVETPLASIMGSNVRFLVLCGKLQSTQQAVRILVLSGTLSVENPSGAVQANRGDLVIALKDTAPTRIAVTANNGFAIDLYRELVRTTDPGDNLLFSPYSAHTAIAMAAIGARGKTALEMEKVLHFPDVARRWGEQPERSTWQASLFHSGAPRLMERIQRSNDPAQDQIRDHLDRLRAQLERQNTRTRSLDGDAAQSSFDEARKTAGEINKLQGEIDHFELSIANGAWVDRSMSIHSDFAALINDGYAIGEFHNVDFKGAPTEQHLLINKWVADHTRGRIQNLLGERDIASDTRMVLANAIYFRGEWQEPFQEHKTKTKNFQLANGETQPVPLMNGHKYQARYGAVRADGSLFDSPDTVADGKQDVPENYPERDGFLMAEMTYDNSGISMVLLVPQDREGLPSLEAKLNNETLATWIEGMKKRRMKVAMPRFRLDAHRSLRDSLQALGMTTAFQRPRDNSGTDFSGIADSSEQLFISDVVQKAFIDVNEKGTVAAAATGLVMTKDAELPRSVPFIPSVRADRPFLFLLRDQDTGTILFMGRVVAPANE